MIRRLTEIHKVDVKLEDMIKLDIESPSSMQVSIHPNSIHNECHRSQSNTIHSDNNIEDQHDNHAISGPIMEQELRRFVESDCGVLYARSFEMLASLHVEFTDLMKISYMMYDGIINSILETNYDDETNNKFVLSVEIVVYTLVLYLDECLSCMIPATKSCIEDLEIETVHSDGDHQGIGLSTCRICLEDIAVGSVMARMPCNHGFHDLCIQKWLMTSHYCPLCRFEMPTSQ